MSLQFVCPECGQWMQTPEESAGKRARCPKCQAVVDVPGAATATAAARATPGVATGDTVSSAYRPPGELEGFPGDLVAQASAMSDELHGAIFGPPTEPQPNKVTLDDMLQRTWTIFTNRLGICLLFALLWFGLIGPVNVLTFVINMTTQLVAVSVNIFWLAFVGQAISQILSLVFQSWLQAGTFKYMINLARYGNTSFNDVLSGLPYLWRFFLFQMLIFLLTCGIPALLGVGGFVALANQAKLEWILAGFAPAVLIGIPFIVWLTLTWYLALPLIVDRNLSLGAALRESSRFMRGNRLIVFAGGLIVALATLFFIVVTICFGSVFAIPVVMLLSAVIYLLATGQGLMPPAPAVPQKPLQPWQ